MVFLKNPNFMKANSPKHVCLWRNHLLFLIKMLWSYFKYKVLLNMMNINKTPGRKHQVIDFCVSDEI